MVPSSMTSLMGATAETAEILAGLGREHGICSVANLNAPGQIVLSGSKEGIAKALAGAKEKGIRMGKELSVAGAYHSRLMASAQEKPAAELAKIEPSTPSVPVVSNVSAAPVSTAEEIRSTLESQVTGSVRWAESIQHLLGAGHDFFLELGPGGVLAGLMNRIQKGTRVIPVTDAGSIETALESL